MKTKSIIALGAGALLLVGATAGASVYVMEMDDNEPSDVNKARVSSNETVNYTETRQVRQVNCDDDNIVGKVIGGAAGGLAGSQIGDGNGKTAATIGGSVGGTLLGEEYIPTKNVTCK